MNPDAVLKDARARMAKGVEHFADGLKGLRTGRTTPALVENVRVDAYGSPMPLNQVATITVPDPRTLMVKPFDPSMCAAIEKGILKSDIGITPESDGKIVRLNVPMMSQEQRDKMAHRVKDLAEAARVTVRNIRRDMIKDVEAAGKAGELSEDQVRDVKDDITKAVKDAEADIDKVAAERTKEIQDA